MAPEAKVGGTLSRKFRDKYSLWAEIMRGGTDRFFVATDAPVQIGVEAELSLELADRTEPLVVEATVVGRRARGGRFEQGVFLHLSTEVVDTCRRVLGMGAGEIAPNTRPRGASGPIQPEPLSDVLLVADDNPDILEFLQRALSRFGFEILTAEDGTAALTLIQSRRPKLVILDVLMPGIDGAEICRVMRANESLVEVPVLFISALESDALHHLADEAGANDYLTKPMDLTDLINLVGSYLKDSE